MFCMFTWGGLVVYCQLVVELWVEMLMTDVGVGCYEKACGEGGEVHGYCPCR